jgi:hypothetical protein
MLMSDLLEPAKTLMLTGTPL